MFGFEGILRILINNLPFFADGVQVLLRSLSALLQPLHVQGQLQSDLSQESLAAAAAAAQNVILFSCSLFSLLSFPITVQAVNHKD